MYKQKKLFTILFFTLIFSSLLFSVSLAAPKPSMPPEVKKAPDKTQNKEVQLSISQEVITTYNNIIKNEPLLIIIDKNEYKLHLFKEGLEIKNYDVAIGKNPGQKQKVGDMTTPTGEFTVDEIIDSNYWTHDFNDGNGEIKGAYGPWFISLETGWNGIGIHGTHNPNSIKTMASEGCIRMNNDEVTELKELISTGIKVIIIDSKLQKAMAANYFPPNREVK